VSTNTWNRLSPDAQSLLRAMLHKTPRYAPPLPLPVSSSPDPQGSHHCSGSAEASVHPRPLLQKSTPPPLLLIPTLLTSGSTPLESMATRSPRDQESGSLSPPLLPPSSRSSPHIPQSLCRNSRPLLLTFPRPTHPSCLAMRRDDRRTKVAAMTPCHCTKLD
jgi:hypothetical protein